MIYSIYFVDENIGWAGGIRWGNPYKDIILKTTNGGKHMENSIGTLMAVICVCVYFINELFGWAVRIL